MGILEQIRHSLAVRLSLWFATSFAIGFTAIFALLYWLLGQQLAQRDYDALQLRLQQYADIYGAAGLGGLRQRVAEDSQTPGVRSLFLRLVGPGGSVVWGKIPPDWIEADVERVNLPESQGSWTERRTYSVRVPRDEQQDLTVLTRPLPDGVVLQVGRSTDSRSVLLAPLRRTFLWVGGAVVVVGFAVGYVSARRATRPLRQIVATARRIIATGSLDERVSTPRGRGEVAELVHQFNTVLDKNSALVRTMREALDNVAHDLRTPLTSLRGTAEMALRESNDPAAVREAMGEVVERTDDVLRLLRALMEISEAEAGMLKLDKAHCDLGELARGAVDVYADLAEASGLTLTLEAAEPVPVQADATRLRQAVGNFIDNALKYTPPGGRVTVRAAVVDGYAVLGVRDTGPGVPEAEQSRVWERLYRGDRSRSQQGLGLGLSVVRAVVEAHGGRVSVRNRPEGGAEFAMALPQA